MKKILFVALLFASVAGFAQDVDIKKGDFGFLKGEKELNVEFNYSNLRLLKENLTNEQYVEQRAKDLNEKDKGNGEIWKKKWKSAPDMIWNTKFLELLLKTYGKEKDVNIGDDLKSAKYTLVVDVVWIYPGWDAAIMKQPAKVSTVLRFVETANKSNVLMEIETDKAPGDQWGNNFSNESRIGEGFAKTAKTIGKMIVKKLK
ncbi:hypothetical protein R1T16_12525 [Flavobacterium sp. DG1-102-2]|uniref:hypothetical protein n=1 Tax=Flavobacterium sp. DG1-102-2 TaxID=3081663 RepID=UPI00294A2851|nr:hypothetical protein [Flavobacterium sp. DG1-102-2]MDV6169252.1 hypothetical protein [Flavobacterium sp. DG1-102-2]